MHSAKKRGSLALIAALAGVLAGAQMFAGQAQAEEGRPAESSAVSTENDTVSLEGHHHYQSPADRANDALLITKVKTALADAGVAQDSPVAVDCDHGKILLSGVMKSPEDVQRAGKIAANTPGVVAVKNQLTWR
jgi:osmotically-inducible protein OsmY